MLLVQGPEPGKIYFENNIPDFIIKKNGTGDSVTFGLLINLGDLPSMTYVFDSDDTIIVRDINVTISKFLKDITNFPTTNYSTSTDNYVNVQWGFYNNENPNDSIYGSFYVLKCDYDMGSTDAETWLKKNFLTQLSSSKKRTTADRHEILSFIQKQGQGNLNVKYSISTKSQTIKGTLLIIPAYNPEYVFLIYRTVSISLSMKTVMNKAGLNNEKEVLYYDIWIEYTSGYTFDFRFYNDRSNYRHSTDFAFTNSFGVMETFTATGMTNTEKQADFSFGNIENRYKIISQDFTSVHEMYSGFLSPNEMHWLDDIVKSYIVSIYTYTDGIREEITLTAIDKTESNANELQAFSFKYRRAKNNHFVIEPVAQRIFDETFDYTFE